MLVEMLGDVTAMQLYGIRLGLIDDGQMSDTMASLAKYFCTVKADMFTGWLATFSAVTGSCWIST
jgi:hypothetical protein